jgi:hypothetical protein
VCKYGWRYDGGGCCSKQQHDNQDSNDIVCIMNCLGQDSNGTRNGSCTNDYYGLTFPTDDCPEVNRGVMCDTRLGYDPHCSFCDLGYKSKFLNDWCCTEADDGCTTTCKNKCTFTKDITGCPYYSIDDCP